MSFERNVAFVVLHTVFFVYDISADTECLFSLSIDKKEITTANFETEVLKSEKPVLIDFWATWCGPCMRQGPVVEELAEEGYAVGKVDVDQNMALAQQFLVVSIPTLILFKDGAEVKRFVGLTSKEELKSALEG